MEGDIHLFGQNIYGRDVEPVIVRRRVGMVFSKSPNPVFRPCPSRRTSTVGLPIGNGVRRAAIPCWPSGTEERPAHGRALG